MAIIINQFRDSVNQTPLHHACSKGHKEVVKYLVQRGANIVALDIKKKLPYEIGEKEMETYVLQHVVAEPARVPGFYFSYKR